MLCALPRGPDRSLGDMVTCDRLIRATVCAMADPPLGQGVSPVLGGVELRGIGWPAIRRGGRLPSPRRVSESTPRRGLRPALSPAFWEAPHAPNLPEDA